MTDVHQEEDKLFIRDKIVEVFEAGNAEQARRRFDKEVCYCICVPVMFQ